MLTEKKEKDLKNMNLSAAITPVEHLFPQFTNKNGKDITYNVLLTPSDLDDHDNSESRGYSIPTLNEVNLVVGNIYKDYSDFENFVKGFIHIMDIETICMISVQEMNHYPSCYHLRYCPVRRIVNKYRNFEYEFKKLKYKLEDYIS